MLEDSNIYVKSKRVTINVDISEFESIYRKLTKTDLFETNLQLFTIAALVGKYKVKKRKKIDKINSYVRYESAVSTDEIEILKCLAISEVQDINILIDHNEMFTICEEYARTGIQKINEWYENKDYDFNDELLNIMNEFYTEEKFL